MFNLKFKNEFTNSFLTTLLKKTPIYHISKKTIVSSIYSKYLIIGGGFTGITLAKILLSVILKNKNDCLFF